MKTYIVTSITGYNLRREPIYNHFSVTAGDWNSGRIAGRDICRRRGFRFVTLNLSRDGDVTPIFPAAPPKRKRPNIIKRYLKFIGSTVTFEVLENGTAPVKKGERKPEPKFLGAYWGKLAGFDTGGRALINTNTGSHLIPLKDVTFNLAPFQA